MKKSAHIWTHLTVRLPEEAAEVLGVICVELGAPGVVTGQRDLRRSSRDHVPTTTKLEAYFPPDVPHARLTRALRSAIDSVAAVFPRVGRKSARIERVELPDYSASWRDHFPPIPVGRRFLIAPTWVEVPEEDADERHVLRIDPGQAFGTGHHPTTRTCLVAIERACAKETPRRGLDLGCGTGVLAMGMRRMGIPRVLAVDNDPLALEATEEASRRNGISGIDCRESLGRVRGTFPIIAANLFSSLHVQMAPEYGRLLEPGGTLILSGLLTSQEDVVRAALRSQRIRVTRRQAISTWVTLIARAPSAPAKRPRVARKR